MLLCLKKDKQTGDWEKQLQADTGKPIKIPWREECILNYCSPFYRTRTTQAEVEDKELVFPKFLQLSFANRAMVYDTSQLHKMYLPCKGDYKVHKGVNFLIDPEKYVDTGISLSHLK